MTIATDKIAGAPISWGVCEVPGWGYQLSGGVLTEMQQVGLVRPSSARTGWPAIRRSWRSSWPPVT